MSGYRQWGPTHHLPHLIQFPLVALWSRPSVYYTLTSIDLPCVPRVEPLAPITRHRLLPCGVEEYQGTRLFPPLPPSYPSNLPSNTQHTLHQVRMRCSLFLPFLCLLQAAPTPPVTVKEYALGEAEGIMKSMAATQPIPILSGLLEDKPTLELTPASTTAMVGGISAARRALVGAGTYAVTGKLPEKTGWKGAVAGSALDGALVGAAYFNTPDPDKTWKLELESDDERLGWKAVLEGAAALGIGAAVVEAGAAIGNKVISAVA